MNQYTIKAGKKLKHGYTTGTCATGATKACARMLLTGERIDHILVKLPRGEEVVLEIQELVVTENQASCCIVKDAGDDPDVTHGIRIYSTVTKADEGIQIDGGIGVGRVTKTGLSIAVGEAAINKVPRKMIEKELSDLSVMYEYTGGFHVEITVPEGVEIAKKTFNSRLGIEGGISILGTTGIVEPMSEGALINTIQVEIDYRVANNQEVLFVAPGNYGLEFAKEHLGLDIDLAVKCSNFIGETLDYAVYKGVEKILLIGHVGKLVKLAAGVMNTHSKIADCRQEIFASHLALQGAHQKMIGQVLGANTTDEIIQLFQCESYCHEVFRSILDKILFHINYRIQNKIKVELVIFSITHGVLMKTQDADDFIRQLKE